MIPDYQEQVKARFAEDGLSQFVKCLRQYCQHYRMPLVNSCIYFDNNGEPHRQSIELTKSDLAEFSSWTSHAERFIEAQPERFNLLNLMKAYRDQVVEFHKWFINNILYIHCSDLLHYDKLMDEVESIKAQDRLYRGFVPPRPSSK